MIHRICMARKRLMIARERLVHRPKELVRDARKFFAIQRRKDRVA